MTRAELLYEARFVIDDAVEPFMVSDDTLLRWLSEGQDKFCERTGYFRDASTYSVTTVADTKSYAISDRIVELHTILRADGSEVPRKRMSDLITYAEQTGEPVFWFSDDETGKISFYPTPDAEYVYTLTCHAMPSKPLNAKTNGTCTEDPAIPERFHSALIAWAGFKFYSVHDQEIQDQKKAADHYGEYRLLVSEGRSAYTTIHGTEAGLAPNQGYVV